ncbi:recombinase family protein [Corynebacterium flavescens]|uniref:recombinase family protein n=1 Tax=Corynebacterium flavescens TaxID=28028 RepID=UPI003FD4FC49
MSNDSINALVVVRLSRQMEESTSAERQETECRKLCKANGWNVVGVASDINVSAGGTTPFSRPELSQWVGKGGNDPGRSPEFDVIVFWRLDRLVRSMMQLWEFMGWAERFGVSLKSVTEAHIDTTTDMGKMVTSLVGSFAQLELEGIRERTSADQHHRLISGKYRGSLPSWGYRPVYDENRGWIVEPDPEQVGQINKAVEWILNKGSMNELARRFNDAGELTPRDRNDIRNGRKPKGRKWAGGRLKAMLTSKAMLGYAITREPVLDKNGKPVRDSRGQKTYYPEERVALNADGSPVQRAEAILDREIWEQVGKELRSREITVSSRSQSLLLQVVFCGVCGNPAYRVPSHQGRKVVYKCKSAMANNMNRCCSKTLQVSQEYMDKHVTSSFLAMFGASVRTVRVWDQGEDNSSEVAELEATIKDLAPELARHRAGSTAFNAIAGQIDALQGRLDDLSKVGVRAPGWKWVPTEETVSEWWDRSDIVERNKYLRECGVRVAFEHREERQRGELPNIEMAIENYEAIMDQLHPEDSAMAMQELLDLVPAGHTLHIEDGCATLEKRAPSHTESE